MLRGTEPRLTGSDRVKGLLDETYKWLESGNALKAISVLSMIADLSQETQEDNL